MRKYNLEYILVTNPSALVYHVKDLCTKDELCVREVEILQNDELRIKSHILFHEICREFIAHQCHMPVTPMPDFCDSLTETLKQLLERHNDEVFSLSHETDELGNMILLDPINEIFDVLFLLCIYAPKKCTYLIANTVQNICIVDADSFRAATMKGFFTKIWAKTKTKFEGSSSDHKLLASYLIETTFLPSMLRYHISRGFSLTELIPLNFCLYIHSNDINVNEWFLCDNHFSIAKCGRAFIEHHLWTVTGNLLITASSEAIIKGRFVVSNT
ncbi:unnamed protein product [Thelazia callipaeda]|uniref:FBA_2 domain-containing protein n=1 Tax=Thelazia callipaeda TaxID=103827 RepID=A0A0N5CXN6_THECL|nr:unnamed protein product [Thelazia callipaeda]